MPNQPHPLHGWIPRKVTASQVTEALEGNVNPFTKKPFSKIYKTIWETRKKLPIYDRIDEFYKMFNSTQIMILVGETGSGKSTQIPQLIAYSDIPHLKGKMIACTQPRRISATTLAQRVATEMDVELGQEVGYSAGFEDMTEPGTTLLKYMTDEMLLREVMNDSALLRYSTIILDEAQERTVATDVLMGLLKEICKKRLDLKVIVMFATLDAEKIQRYFGATKRSAPLLEIPGRAHPVEVFYTQEPESDYFEAAIRTVLYLHQEENPGDILLFLTREDEIEDACRRLKVEADALSAQDPTVGPLMCIPLYFSLPAQQQQRIFDPAPKPRRPGGTPGRKVVVSTNIAETSLTIDGIVYVVDPGFSEQRVYNPRTRVETILASPISKATAFQRARRAGRTRPGKCFRLYTEKDYVKELEEQSYPAILCSKLSSVILTLVKCGVTDLIRFDWLDRPAPESIMRGLEELNYLAALDDDGNLTALGAIMAEFPLDPQMSKLLITSPEFHCSNEILTIISMLSVSNVFLRPPNMRKEADAAEALLSIPEGDHLTLLNIYNSYVENKYNSNWAWNNHLSARALIQAENVRNQLLRIVERFGLDSTSKREEGPQLYDNIRKTMICGFFMQVAHREGYQGGYKTVKDNQPVSLHPSCGLDTSPEWVLFNEFILTTKPFIRTVTTIEPEWLLDLAGAYYDIKEFPAGETKTALTRAINKRLSRQMDSGAGDKGHKKKKRVKK